MQIGEIQGTWGYKAHLVVLDAVEGYLKFWKEEMQVQVKKMKSSMQKQAAKITRTKIQKDSFDLDEDQNVPQPCEAILGSITYKRKIKSRSQCRLIQNAMGSKILVTKHTTKGIKDKEYSKDVRWCLWAISTESLATKTIKVEASIHLSNQQIFIV